MNSATPNGRERRPATLPRVAGPQVTEEMAGDHPEAVHSTHSSAREKVLEHLFIGDLLRALWCLGIHDVQVLRPEVDRNGYEFMIGCNGTHRSVQLKTTRKGGKAQAV